MCLLSSYVLGPELDQVDKGCLSHPGHEVPAGSAAE